MEPVPGSILVRPIIGEDIVAVDRPPASNPRVELLVNNTLLGELVVEFLLCGDLELRVHSLALAVVVLLVVVPVTS